IIKVGASSMSRYADSQYRASYKSPPSTFRGAGVSEVGVVGGICVIDIERLTRCLDTSRRRLVVATPILPGYRDCRSYPCTFAASAAQWLYFRTFFGNPRRPGRVGTSDITWRGVDNTLHKARQSVAESESGSVGPLRALYGRSQRSPVF